MPRKKSNKAILADIREVLKDMNALKIRNSELGDEDLLDESLALVIIEDAINGTEEPVTRDYRLTKAALQQAASPG